MSRHPEILIIGAGITGLTAALALHRAGCRAQVFEQAPALAEVGAGLTVGPNASRVLAALDLGGPLADIGQVPRHSGVIAHDSGATLTRTLRGESAYREAFGSPFWHVHRADLLAMLVQALDGKADIRCGHRLTGVETVGDRVRAYFDNGERVEGDVLLACDGLKSAVRTTEFDPAPPRFTGFVAWRGLVASTPDTAAGLDPDFAVTSGDGRMFTRYPIRGGRWINFVAIAREPDWREEGWMCPATREEVMDQFEGWHAGVTSLLAALPRHGCFKWGLHVRAPLDRWVQGRVALAGDAAHPMTPFLGLGAGMGIEDAWVLGRAFASAASEEEALQRYQAARTDRANRVQQLSERQGLAMLGEGLDGEHLPPLTGPDPIGIYGHDVTQQAV